MSHTIVVTEFRSERLLARRAGFALTHRVG